MIKNKQVLDDVWVFAKKSQTTEGKWKLSDGLSAKCDKVFIRYEYVMDINEIQKKYNPEEVVLNDDEISYVWNEYREIIIDKIENNG